MKSAQSVISAIDSALRKVGGPARSVYVRVMAATGSSTAKLLGRSTRTYADSLLDPQPLVTRLGSLATQYTRDAAVLGSNSKRFFATDYLITFSGSLTSDLHDPNVLFVMKDSSGHEEVCEIVDVDDSAAISGTSLIFTVIARSTSR